MRAFRKFPLLILMMMCIAPLTVLAQACPAIVGQALKATHDACANLERNQACYGNISLEATPRDGVRFVFNKPGDVVSLAAVSGLKLSSMNAAEDQWGVALLKLQANLPDTLPGQNVTALLFGDVTITNNAPTNTEAVTVNVTAQKVVNLRSLPTTGGALVGRLQPNQTLQANGRLADNSWLRVSLADGTLAWVAADVAQTAGDVSLLPIVDPATGEPVRDERVLLHLRHE
jgi:hypothetical protein